MRGGPSLVGSDVLVEVEEVVRVVSAFERSEPGQLGSRIRPAHAGLAFVAGLALTMLRYRLFDLDVVLTRTIVYSVLILVAVASYLLVTAVLVTISGSGFPVDPLPEVKIGGSAARLVRASSQALAAVVPGGLDGGRTPTGLDALAWAEEAAARGAGELLVTSMDADGQKTGYDLELVTAMTSAVGLPVIASGGAGEIGHFADACLAGADAVLAASVFHFGQLSITEVKQGLAAAGLPVRT